MTGLLRRLEFLRQRDLKPRYDVVIVGGGVNGLSLAFHLAEYHGIRDVAVLERSYIGSGGSGRNTQVVRATYNTTETVPLYATALDMNRTLSQELDYYVMYSPRGVIDLATSDGEVDAMARRGNAMRLAGIDADLLEARDLIVVELFTKVFGR